eukprot:CAMPEP_0175935824 /NCGR_PEP_ID=MMETSP0108-20121206/21270_1 /TAXON_ID=195067 ORGANISM="Goniomonas pacifica, Strain CCMP1869" /NCGR_SAMPLE_ID=MMETSP0108 /ASSEMBLY_ACC=CAM_ASM_000204 /LENGTH=173 /DNA_ID=CAMNT_0017259837 /DNA_START=25 /DNA_END=546 /DNA_ORIENTATION=+
MTHLLSDAPLGPRPSCGQRTETITVEGRIFDLVECSWWHLRHTHRKREFLDAIFESNRIAALVWVVDAADRARFEESREELVRLFGKVTEEIPLLVVLNKVDLPDAAGSDEIESCLQLNQAFAGTVKVLPISLVRRVGLAQMMRWVVEQKSVEHAPLATEIDSDLLVKPAGRR